MLGVQNFEFHYFGWGGVCFQKKNIFKGMNQLDIFCKSPLILIFLGCIAKSTFCKAKAKNWTFGGFGEYTKISNIFYSMPDINFFLGRGRAK